MAKSTPDEDRGPRSHKREAMLRNLQLIEWPHGSVPKNIAAVASDAGLIYIDGCTRSMALSLGELPEHLITSGATRFNGKEAYGRALEYMTGLLSKAPGETQIVGQFRTTFERHRRENAGSLDNYEKLFQWLSEDNGVVRSHVTNNLQSAYFETVAQRMDGRKADVPVVVILDEGKDGKLSETCTNLIRQLGSFSHQKPSQIVITHPNASVLAKHYAALTRAQSRGTQHASIKALAYEDLVAAPYGSEVYNTYQYIYFCPACGSMPEAETRLAEMQREKAAFGSKVVLMGGEKNTRQTAGTWTEDIAGVITPDAISTAQKHKKTENGDLIARGKIACANCATSRDNGKRPLINSLSLAPADYAHHSGASTQPANVRNGR